MGHTTALMPTERRLADAHQDYPATATLTYMDVAARGLMSRHVRAALDAHLDTLASGVMSTLVTSVVVNETKTDGVYDLELSWRPDVAATAADANDARPAFFTAVQEQLGLKLEAGRRPVDVLVIESLERPLPD